MIPFDFCQKSSGSPVEQKYSFPPNNTPISKVYVFGRPVYVREPFVVPQRDNYRRIHDNNVQRDERSYRAGAEAVGDAVEQALAQESLFLTESDPSRYQLPERPYPSTNPYSVLPPLLEQKQGYPLPQCYTNDSGKCFAPFL
ncbi:hypothetical protein ANCCAN_14198 [Ancylostoma caninum]|uniref:Uncharacterized protein n=1 Tax=Ancylostoma caninum TaxID=29170 RepID=A0A368GAS8_ANCCA|nr:hypothetical protein ANCCAN_14198 [Ancylostoma caninum]